jgi:hypothetical protein
LSSPAIAANAIAISIQAMRVAVLLIDLDAVADVGAIQIRGWWRKTVAGVDRVASVWGGGAGSVVGGAVAGGALAMTRPMVAPGPTSPPACLDWEMTVPEGYRLVVL